MTQQYAGKQRSAGRVAVVTGATRGIGLAITRALLEDGLLVALVYRQNQEAARSAQGELKEWEGRTLFINADVGHMPEATRVVDCVVAEWGRVDILVNNAGVFQFAFLEEMDEGFLDSIFRSNFKSAFCMIKSALPWLKKADHPRILNASSISGRLADVGLIAYGSSKASLDMLTRVASAELAPFGITVNAYAPGIVFTEMTREMIETRGKDQVKQIPAGKFGAPEDVANLVRYLCSPQADYITGEVIGIDGGMLKVQNPYRAHERAQRGS